MSLFNGNKTYQNYFEGLTKIPHGSGNEKAISDHIVAFGKELGLVVRQDAVYNVVIDKVASKGYEDHPAIVLQAHIDMVDEKNNDSNHDFEKDGLDLYIEDGFLKAKGTTLGGDDGAGVSYIMSILADPNLKHPRIQALFTTQEESTMEGAFKLDPKWIDARRLINIDGEEEDVSNTASAGGIDVAFTRQLTYKNVNTKGFKLSIGGLLGGHSGGEIHRERGNANKIVSRIAYQINKVQPICLADFVGGLKINAIPRESSIVFTSEASFEAVKAIVDEYGNQVKKELEHSDAGFTFELSECQVAKVIDSKTSADILKLVYTMPCGFRHKSDLLDGLTIASENIGVISMSEQFSCEISIRGALESYVRDMEDELHVLGEAFGFDTKEDNWYPCWDYMENSHVRDVMEKLYEEIHGSKMRLEAIHGGLECGIFKNKFPDMDMVTMGPNLYDVHTPGEKLDLTSFDTTYTFLCKFLERL
ncbi:MAG: beta-Ala-His dipeptidase [Erysipelotrichaceae bacterium]